MYVSISTDQGWHKNCVIITPAAQETSLDCFRLSAGARRSRGYDFFKAS